MNDSNYYGILPAIVRYDEEISDFQKILFTEITCLSNTWGYCTALNPYFAKVFKKTPETISRCISKLASKKYIRVSFEGTDNSNRKIYPLLDIYGNQSDGVLTKMSRGIDKNVNRGIDKNVNYNSNIESNNKTNIKKGENKEVFTPPQREEVLTVYAQIFTDSKVKNARAWADWEATKFFDHYAANGWKVGSKGRLTPMKNWQQAATRWAKKCIEDGISDKRLPDKYAQTSAALADFPKQRKLVF